MFIEAILLGFGMAISTAEIWSMIVCATVLKPTSGYGHLSLMAVPGRCGTRADRIACIRTKISTGRSGQNYTELCSKDKDTPMGPYSPKCVLLHSKNPLLIIYTV